ncbi:HTH_Tnp_Tc3_2 domain-containing protein [Trichonephila clavipes]|nr:HTH_Tnp_Tc3_2 domain-containing protein [Trichonephila clavipes]
MGRSVATIRRCWQEWGDNGRFQRHDSSGQPRATANRGNRLIVRSAVTAPDSSLSTIRRVTRTRVSTMIIHRWLIERNLRSYRSLLHLPLTPAHCRERLRCRTPLVIIRGTLIAQRCVDLILRTVLLPFLLPYPGLIFQQDYARPHTARVTLNCLISCQTLPWPARSLSNRACLGYDGKTTASPGDVDHLA